MSDTKKKTETKRALSQKFEMGTVHRDQLKNAPYNPRKINDRNLKALKASLAKYGLVSPITWNKRTGNIVGGHQRVTALDCVEHTKNYLLDVAIVDVDEREEVALNIALNNQATMGEFDFSEIKDLADSFSLDLQNDLLFDRDDMLVSFGADLEDMQVQKRDASADPELLQQIRDKKKEFREELKAKKAELGDYTSNKPVGTIIVVFRDQSQKEWFCRKVEIPEDSRVVHADDILDLD